MARRTLAARGRDAHGWSRRRGGALAVTMAGEVLLPAPDVRIAPTTFEEWLSGSRA